MGPRTNKVQEDWRKAKRSRPTKLSIGMSYTGFRSNHNFSKDALSLAVRGTNAKWSVLMFRVTSNDSGTCVCCGQKLRTLRLNDKGRLRLNSLKRRRAKRKPLVRKISLPKWKAPEDCGWVSGLLY